MIFFHKTIFLQKKMPTPEGVSIDYDANGRLLQFSEVLDGANHLRGVADDNIKKIPKG